MKKLIMLVAVILLTVNLFAQTPEKMSYQAVLRNASNGLIVSTSVGMKISILKNSVLGEIVYEETQVPITDANGLVTLEIGTGTVVLGSFETIDWSSGPYFIKTETDLTGGTNYTIIGTSQLMSVPYALHAKTVSSYNETDPKVGLIDDGYFPIWSGSSLQTGSIYDYDGWIGIGTDDPESELHVNGVITDLIGNSNNWNDAYSWGNHADANYVTLSYLAALSDIADEFTATASQTEFTLSEMPADNSKVKMYINGLRISNSAYSYAGNNLTYNPVNNNNYVLSDGDRIQFDYYKANIVPIQ